jgi:hypothetical protein
VRRIEGLDLNLRNNDESLLYFGTYILKSLSVACCGLLLLYTLFASFIPLLASSFNFPEGKQSCLLQVNRFMQRCSCHYIATMNASGPMGTTYVKVCVWPTKPSDDRCE